MKNILEEIRTKLNSNLQADDGIPPTSEIRELVSVQSKKKHETDFYFTILIFSTSSFKLRLWSDASSCENDERA